MEIPKILLDKADEITEKLNIKYPELAPMFKKCFLNTMETTITKLDDGGYFVITGDIPAMWLRDSAFQVLPYVRYAGLDENLKEILRGVIARQAKFICVDSYSNAFNAKGNSHSFQDKTNFYDEIIWERKYEVDSLCAPVYLAHKYYMETLDDSIFTDDFYHMLQNIVATFKREQNHEEASQYYFNRENCPERDTLPNEGKGNPVAYTGMTWSGFRPSDDRCVYGYLIPSNMMAVCALKKMAELANFGYEDTKLESECRSLAFDIDDGIQEHAIIEHPKYGNIYAYEVDGMGNVILMDDANVPSLLSAPYIGYLDKNNEIYQNTRKFILSIGNPWFFDGGVAKGIGSPHTGTNKIWPISIIMQALTSDSEEEIAKCLKTLSTTHAGTNFMHESFDKNDDTLFTRPWFAWANSLFAELVIRLLKD